MHVLTFQLYCKCLQTSIPWCIALFISSRASYWRLTHIYGQQTCFEWNYFPRLWRDYYGPLWEIQQWIREYRLKHLPREREEIKYLQIITKTQRWWEKNVLQIGEQFISNDGLRHASQTSECIGIAWAPLPEFPFQLGKRPGYFHFSLVPRWWTSIWFKDDTLRITELKDKHEGNNEKHLSSCFYLL